jgi:hypothetical protein
MASVPDIRNGNGYHRCRQGPMIYPYHLEVQEIDLDRRAIEGRPNRLALPFYLIRSFFGFHPVQPFISLGVYHGDPVDCSRDFQQAVEYVFDIFSILCGLKIAFDESFDAGKLPHKKHMLDDVRKKGLDHGFGQPTGFTIVNSFRSEKKDKSEKKYKPCQDEKKCLFSIRIFRVI